jgi:membrane protease YdiL (CAAX protease family)
LDSATDATVVNVLVYAPVRFLYGGITEELLLRYGLMSALAFIGWVLTGRQSGGPGSGVMWVAIIISAVLFGIGHLPALAQSVDLTQALVARTILLNAIAGVLFGWLYWQRGLEAAMVAHAAFHIPLVVLSLIQVAIL